MQLCVPEQLLWRLFRVTSHTAHIPVALSERGCSIRPRLLLLLLRPPVLAMPLPLLLPLPLPLSLSLPLPLPLLLPLPGTAAATASEGSHTVDLSNPLDLRWAMKLHEAVVHGRDERLAAVFLNQLTRCDVSLDCRWVLGHRAAHSSRVQGR